MSRRRRILLAALAAFALLVAFAPLLARTNAARRLVAGRISAALGRPVEIGSLDAGWASGVTLKGLIVRNAAAEFREAPLLEAASVRIEDGLPGLVFSGASRVAVDGLKVRVEEQAGGRTNVDDLVKVLATPRPPAPRREARPFRLTLTGASIQVRRLVPRPQPRPVDPFREDPVILDAHEGLLAFGLEEMDLRLETTPVATTLDLAARVAVAGRRGRADLALRLGAEGPSGRVRLEGIDLAFLEPFAPGLAGRIDVGVEGSAEGADVKIRAEGLRAGGVEEAWAELSLRVRKEGEGVTFDAVALRTASGAFSLDGRGAWPPRGVELRAQAPPHPLGLRMRGPLLLDVRGGPELKGTISAPDLAARFEVALEDGRAHVRSLDAKAFQSTVSARGEIGGVFRLSGSADVNLADLRPLLREGKSLEGRLEVPVFALDDRSLKADATVTRLLARGIFAEDVDLERGELHVDATLSEDRDSVRVARAELDGLLAEGTVEGLRKGPVRVDGAIRGAIALTPIHARLLGLEEVRGLRGQVTLDAVAATGAKGIEASGRAAVEGLHVETGRGVFDLARFDAQGAYRAGDLELGAKADGLRLEASLAGGQGRVALDVDAIEHEPLLAALLPAELDLRGPLSVRADVARGPWSVRGAVESTALTAKAGERGFERERARVSFAAQEGDAGWSVSAPEIALEGLGVKASVGDGFLGGDGTKTFRFSLEAPLERLATLGLPCAPEGRLSLGGTAAYDGRWTFSGEARAEDASVVVSGRRTPPRWALLEFLAAPEGEAVKFRRLRLATRLTELEGTAALGPSTTLRMKGRARLEELSLFVPALEGSGEILLDEVAFALAAGGALEAWASARAGSIRVEGGRLQGARIRSRLEGRFVRGALEDVRTDFTVTAARATRGNILAEGLSVRERGAGRSGAYELGTRIETARLVVGATSWEQVGVDVAGRLDRVLGERPATGLRGKVMFARWHLGPFLWEDATGDVALEGGDVVVRELLARLHGGTVRAEGRLVPAGGRLSWEGTADAKGVVLSEEIGRPLSFVVPFLRVERKAGRLAGRADVELKLAAEDTTDAAIFRTLAGAGKARFYDIEAQNSILLPLLSLRLDKAILREPFRFKALEVAFEVGEGAIRSAPFELEATPFGIKVKEAEVGLDGTVNVLVVPGIVPLRVKGTLDDPDVRPAPLAPFR